MTEKSVSTAVLQGVGLVVAAGGSSSRFGGESKLLADLGGMPVFVWCLRELSKALEPGMIVLSAPAADIPKFEESLKWNLPELPVKLVAGGETRTSSVLNALKALPESAKMAAVHDAARPFVKCETLAECVSACLAFGGAVASKRVTDTVKEADESGVVVKTFDRSRLWAMETPQVFMRDALQEACEKAIAAGAQITDDASAMELFSKAKVKLVENPHFNLKITYPNDLELARSRLPFRT